MTIILRIKIFPSSVKLLGPGFTLADGFLNGFKVYHRLGLVETAGLYGFGIVCSVGARLVHDLYREP